MACCSAFLVGGTAGGTTGSGTFAMTLLMKYGDSNVPNVTNNIHHTCTLSLLYPGLVLTNNFGVEYSSARLSRSTRNEFSSTR